MRGASQTVVDQRRFNPLYFMFYWHRTYMATVFNDRKGFQWRIGKTCPVLKVDMESIHVRFQVDADGNGEIDFDEFCACMKKSQSIVKSTNEELIRECFDIFDQDHNGIITESEFKVGVNDYGLFCENHAFLSPEVAPFQYVAKELGDFTEELAEKVFRELDVSANGHLSADQFATVMEDYLLSDTNKVDQEKDENPSTCTEAPEPEQ